MQEQVQSIRQEIMGCDEGWMEFQSEKCESNSRHFQYRILSGLLSLSARAFLPTCTLIIALCSFYSLLKLLHTNHIQILTSRFYLGWQRKGVMSYVLVVPSPAIERQQKRPHSKYTKVYDAELSTEINRSKIKIG